MSMEQAAQLAAPNAKNAAGNPNADLSSIAAGLKQDVKNNQSDLAGVMQPIPQMGAPAAGAGGFTGDSPYGASTMSADAFKQRMGFGV